MSAPDTNVERQAHNHRPALSGITIAVLFAAILSVGLVAWVVYQGGEPEGAALQIDGRTGAAATVDE